MKNVLITGGAGFIPASLAGALLQTGRYRVVLVDNMLTGKKRNVIDHPDCRFVRCDVNDYPDISAVMLGHRFDLVFHYAAVVGVQRTIENPKSVLEDLKGLMNIFELSKNTGVGRVFYSSSSEVYGEPVHLPQHEFNTPLNSRLPYAVVKNVGECFCRAYQQEFGLDYTVLRFFNTYGPLQSDDFVVSRFLEAALAGARIPVFGDGNQTRTFCYIDDNLELTIRALEDGLFINDVVNVGSHRLITINELAEMVISVTGSTSRVMYLPPLKEGDMSRRQPDNSRMLQALGRPLVELEEGLRKVLKSRLENRT